MDRLIYTALTGLAARTRSQAVMANNLANAQTTGFRREIVAAEGRYLTGGATPARAQAGAFSVATPRENGKVAATGRALDIALGGNAWLAIQGPVVAGNPTEAYTRRGDLDISTSGILQNGDGRAVLNQNGVPITVAAGASLTIAPDGTLTTRTNGIDANIGRLKLVAARALEKGADGMFTSKDPLPVDPDARLASGALETSNVQTAGALAELVEESRGFEVNARLLTIAKDIDERTARLMAFESN
ncbi:flagellar basal body rod protein FlgF [Polymorphobacter fuscus]|uniref:Flagellar basal-body rod protein FlgF n=1 Tax=Sandarakinorhabdus fusca TaxID=1439888 RepID=A0A7C9GM97_9SPHN|nr:flagellar hook-basal body complex protein [Polymorphobacter fuscus]KAB7648229.1 flagellar hook-basal body complex protein [Polymorphobacter fuscus]MQT15735.1 flagellar hook-basal body complex protein [Polymorphobacter fuscus]NJC07994.1 flagellar basal-body rod protein FlgF [Polymorphobacter fuscus]